MIRDCVRADVQRWRRGGPVAADLTVAVLADEPSLGMLLDEGCLLPGHQLDLLDLNWFVDAVVTDDGTVQTDGVHDFFTLDDAARYLEVTNMSGFDFWALEHDGGRAPLAELMAAGPCGR